MLSESPTRELNRGGEQVTEAQKSTRAASGVRLVVFGTLFAVFSVMMGSPFLLFASAIIVLVGFSRIPRRRRS